MQLELVYKLTRMFAEPILKKVFHKESGAARLQQVGLFTLIFMLQADEEPVTAVRLSRMTGQSESQIHHQMKKLLDLKLIDRVKIPNPHGRGRVFKLVVKHTPQTKRLVKALTSGIVGSVSGRKPRRARRWAAKPPPEL
jgi:predicted transcriptional regulator